MFPPLGAAVGQAATVEDVPPSHQVFIQPDAAAEQFSFPAGVPPWHVKIVRHVLPCPGLYVGFSFLRAL